MRGRSDRTRLEQLENEVINLRTMARRLWRSLRMRNAAAAYEAYAHAGTDEMRVMDPMFDACEVIYEQQRIVVMPCRVILEPINSAASWNAWPTQDEMYVARLPDGTTRNLKRDQVLMMAGMDPAAVMPDEQEESRRG